ncbi:MAG: hypothetical protein D6728_01665 [Cyanobacteria bacterium J055]|nr:MAG: hypothetical protein D6728_01665 [Cyanobacteria bacterium J055]
MSRYIKLPNIELQGRYSPSSEFRLGYFLILRENWKESTPRDEKIAIKFIIKITNLILFTYTWGTI